MAILLSLILCARAFAWTEGQPLAEQPQRIEFTNPGVLTGETIKLESEPLPPHTSVTIKLKVSIRGSWDGDKPGDGPDALVVRLDDGRTLHDTTFSHEGTQSYPDRIRGFSNSGVFSPATLQCTVPHRADRLRLEINAVLNEKLLGNRWNAENESWMLKSCEFILSDVPPPKLDDATFQQRWDQLAEVDPAVAWAAVDQLVTADPDSVMKQIREKMDALAGARDVKSIRARIPKLIATLDQGDLRARAAATHELSSLSLVDLPILRKARTEDLSLEGKLQLDEIIQTIRQRHATNGPETRRTLRLQYALGLIPSPVP